MRGDYAAGVVSAAGTQHKESVMRKLGIAICLMVVGFGTAWAEDTAPDPPDDEQTICPDDYHPIEGLDGFCAQNDGTEDDECPGNWSEIGVGDSMCQCLGTTDFMGNCDTGGWQPPACPSGWHNSGYTGVCIPDSMSECPPGYYVEPVSKRCRRRRSKVEDPWPPPKVVVFDWDDVNYIEADENVVHYDLVGGHCAIGSAYNVTTHRCESACVALPGVPCQSEDVIWIYTHP